MTTEHRTSRRKILDERMTDVQVRLNEVKTLLGVILAETLDIQMEMASLGEAEA